MQTIIYYYTGTGNSLWVAWELAKNLGDAELVPIVDCAPGPIKTDAKNIGVVFPVHMWGLPQRVLDWAKRIEADPKKYYFAAAVNAGQVSRTLIQLRNLMAKRKMRLAAGTDCDLPSNYIPWGGAEPKDFQEGKFQKVRARVRMLTATIKASRVVPVDRGPLWQRIVFTLLYHLSFPRIKEMDKDFLADSKCNACGICVKVCPAHNIELVNKKPTWKHRCEQCMACIQWCPQAAIQYGEKTAAYERYHHPAVSCADIMPTQSGT